MRNNTYTTVQTNVTRGREGLAKVLRDILFQFLSHTYVFRTILKCYITPREGLQKVSLNVTRNEGA